MFDVLVWCFAKDCNMGKVYKSRLLPNAGKDEDHGSLGYKNGVTKFEMHLKNFPQTIVRYNACLVSVIIFIFNMLVFAATI